MCCNIQTFSLTGEDDTEDSVTRSAETSRAPDGKGGDSEDVEVDGEGTSRSIAIPGPSKPRASATNQKARKRTGQGRKAGGKKRKVTKSTARMRSNASVRMKIKTIESKKLSMDEMKNEDHPGHVVNAAGENLYNVERILKKSVAKGVVWYRIKWEGCDKTKNCWKRAENLGNCSVVAEFELNEERKKLAKLARRGKGKKGKSRPSSKRTSPPNQPAASDKSEPQPPFVADPNDPDPNDPDPNDPDPNDPDPNNDPDLPIDEANENAEAAELEQETNIIMGRTFNTLFEFKGEEGTLFRREWNQNEVPVSVVGSTIVDGTIVYLVRIRNHDADGPVGKPLDFSDCVMVLPTISLLNFNNKLMEYYEHRLGPNGLGLPIIAAAKEEILRRCAMMQ
ncbi:Chromobox protein 6 [Orchesella cincta]|uniref:Chromobox protein 6 n=1 Tax=Orchesella cincta TaxID=48709 RepID=A0A1D2MHC5_ORCCI|nr:Chromobox protein 6 [Orchesella cincta]